jgi:hypothetical protein
MTTLELDQGETCIARVRGTPAGEIELVPGDESDSAYGPVEIEWFADRVTVTAVGAGPASIARTYSTGEAGQDLVVEVRLPSLDELTETVPGAD